MIAPSRRDFHLQLRLEITAYFLQPSQHLAGILGECNQLLRTKDDQAQQRQKQHLRQAHALSSGAVGVGVFKTGVSSFPCMAALKPRMPSPIPFPSSGSFLGPKTSKAIPAM